MGKGGENLGRASDGPQAWFDLEIEFHIALGFKRVSNLVKWFKIAI